MTNNLLGLFPYDDDQVLFGKVLHPPFQQKTLLNLRDLVIESQKFSDIKNILFFRDEQVCIENIEILVQSPLKGHELYF